MLGVVLDSSLGKPATEIQVLLQKGVFQSGNMIFHDLSSRYVDNRYLSHNPITGRINNSTRYDSSTDNDGRCSNLLEPGCVMTVGVYKIVFKTQEYFEASKRKCFYPFVEVRLCPCLRYIQGCFHLSM